MQKYDTTQLQKYDIFGPCQERDCAPFPSEGVSKRYADYEFSRLARGAMASLLTGTVNLVFAVVAGIMASGDLTGPVIWKFLSGL